MNKYPKVIAKPSALKAFANENGAFGEVNVNNWVSRFFKQRTGKRAWIACQSADKAIRHCFDAHTIMFAHEQEPERKLVLFDESGAYWDINPDIPFGMDSEGSIIFQ